MHRAVSGTSKSSSGNWTFPAEGLKTLWTSIGLKAVFFGAEGGCYLEPYEACSPKTCLGAPQNAGALSGHAIRMRLLRVYTKGLFVVALIAGVCVCVCMSMCMCVHISIYIYIYICRERGTYRDSNAILTLSHPSDPPPPISRCKILDPEPPIPQAQTHSWV